MREPGGWDELFYTHFATGYAQPFVDAGLFQHTPQGKWNWYEPQSELYALFKEPVLMDKLLPALRQLVAGDAEPVRALGVTEKGLAYLLRLAASDDGSDRDAATSHSDD